jgi:catechol 2,3-dioxygenase-like lactoylglutathione lyase family enzyme
MLEANARTAVFPGGIRQLGFIVPNLEAALEQWTALGVAPWLVVRKLTMAGCHYRGVLSEPVISLALANAGDMQFELIQQHDETPSIYREFLEATGGGFNQVAYWVEDVDAVRDGALEAGWSEVWSGESGGTKFIYLEHPDAPVAIVELMELNVTTNAMADAIRQAAATWSPGQPVIIG